MSTVSESKPWCDITSEANELGMLSQPLMAASPRRQISRSVLVLIALCLEARRHLLVTAVLGERFFPVQAQRIEDRPVLDREQHGRVAGGEVGVLVQGP